MQVLDCASNPAPATRKLRCYIFGLALTAFTAPQAAFLRMGCELTGDPENPAMWEIVKCDGSRKAFEISHEDALHFAECAATAFGIGPSRSFDFDPEKAKAALSKKEREWVSHGKHTLYFHHLFGQVLPRSEGLWSRVAAAARNGRDGEEEFKWFEGLEAPDILAPKTEEAAERTIYVPNNDSDKTLDRQKRVAEKEVHPLRIQGNDATVHYLWEYDHEGEGLAGKFAGHARLLTAVGWGVDLVAGSGRLLSDAEAALREEYPGERWKHMSDAPDVLRCPKIGTLADLRAAYETALNRFNGKVYTPARRRRVDYP